MSANITINLDEKTDAELKTLLDKIKVSDADFETKSFYIKEIEKRLGVNDLKIEVLKSMVEGSADPIKLD